MAMALIQDIDEYWGHGTSSHHDWRSPGGPGRQHAFRPGHGDPRARRHDAARNPCACCRRPRPWLQAVHGAPGTPAQRRALAKTITLLESTRADHRAARRRTAERRCCRQRAGRFRLGISGVPGVGKSTFIEALGLFLIEARPPRGGAGGGPRVPACQRRQHPRRQDAHGAPVDGRTHAYIRPSPASGTLGGVAEKTREAMLVCEAAGYDIVIVETVGVGQSETAVAGMTDMFVLLQLPNAGDDLQAIKKGVMELADLVVINKADLDEAAATRARAQITSALRFGLHGRMRTHGETRWHTGAATQRA